LSDHDDRRVNLLEIKSISLALAVAGAIASRLILRVCEVHSPIRNYQRLFCIVDA